MYDPDQKTKIYKETQEKHEKAIINNQYTWM